MAMVQEHDRCAGHKFGEALEIYFSRDIMNYKSIISTVNNINCTSLQLILSSAGCRLEEQELSRAEHVYLLDPTREVSSIIVMIMGRFRASSLSLTLLDFFTVETRERVHTMSVKSAKTTR
ncbi:hypothetical protein R1flu_006520 [Riccia fluitans]|uniref:Uncharacterized protein n=1 Tax=Riccia fluitans TaxID=41844 RepID=A0ABD1YW92_9MARC